MAIKFGETHNDVKPNTKPEPEEVTSEQEAPVEVTTPETKTKPKQKKPTPTVEKKTQTEKKKPLAGLQVDGPGKNYSIYLETALVEEIDAMGEQEGIKNRSKIIKHLLKQALNDLKNK